MSKKRITICLVCVVASLAMCGAVRAEEIKGVGTKEPGAAMKAFNLRMAGKVDLAKEFLEKALAENPKDAAAHYELARIQFHRALGNMSNLEKDFGNAQQSIEKAVKNGPDNVIYRSFAGQIRCYQAYLSAMTEDQHGTKENLARAIGAFESALKLKPDYHQAMLYLVELYSQYSEDEGGDISKAEEYARQLEAMDDVLGAKANSILSEKDRGIWKGIIESYTGNDDVLE